MEFCPLFKSCNIGFNVYTNKVTISRCSLKTKYTLAEYTIEEWKAVSNKIEEINKFIDVWPNRNKERTILPGHCNILNPKVSTCYFDKPLTHFSIFEVAIDMSCNADCKWCCFKDEISKVRHNSLTKTLKDLYFETLNSIVDSANYNIEIRLTDHGEPLLWKKETIAFLKKCSTNKFIEKIKLNTNGIGLLDKDISFWLMKLPHDICISLNALSEQTHQDIMRIEKFNEIVETANSFENNTCYFSVIVSNITELEEFARLLPSFRQKSKLKIILISLSYEEPLFGKVQNFIALNKDMLNGTLH